MSPAQQQQQQAARRASSGDTPQGSPTARANNTCPPFGSKAVIGRRSKMEDACVVVPSLLSVVVDSGGLEESLPPRVAPLLRSARVITRTSPGSGASAEGSLNSSLTSGGSGPRPAGPLSDGDTSGSSVRETLHFFGVFDGHGGADAALHCSRVLHTRVREGASPPCASPLSLSVGREAVEAALTRAFHLTDDEFGRAGGYEHLALVGTTAVVVLIGASMLYVANAGDSRAVLCRDGLALPLTDDHKAAREDETARVEAAGGQILFWNGVRVMGLLAVSRAIGDHSLRPYVIAEPEVTIVHRHPADELLVMASDGLWDVMGNQEACTLARKCLLRARQRGSSRQSAARVAATVLTRAAVDRGSRDNVTVVVVDLSSASPEEAVAEAASAAAPGDPGAGPAFTSGIPSGDAAALPGVPQASFRLAPSPMESCFSSNAIAPRFSTGAGKGVTGVQPPP
ncbi:putative protein phosphatase 2C 6 [Auxenochlorella protothecoides]|uniref:protein-serine/threonine phosphatase n=1 Tax=Auxenochlorella protothecoides TaxID=3075 RepID=A0A087SL22_AUXPR|nr:putative protein phosphatase 2C 6 [Auxenochlorella protothecoides]KFM26426.1 putative protein phosphatase 2C 6 [Auxenochlorella protothecoides]